jgi:hypothetical protein
MTVPLKLKGSELSGPDTINSSLTAGTPVYGIQQMSSSEIYDGIIYAMLREFAKVNNTSPKTGDLTLLDTIGDLPTTLIGDFVDTNRTNEVGTTGTVSSLTLGTSSVERSVYQNLSRVTGTVVRPVCFNNGRLEEMSDQQIMDAIISPALDRMTNRGIGSYHFSQGIPRDPLTGDDIPGTWSLVFQVTDNYRGGTVGTNSNVYYINPEGTAGSVAFFRVPAQNTNITTTYTLWRKTNDTAPSTITRPLKYANTADRGKHLAEMTNADILTLLIPFRNAIIDDGRGRYRFQNALPVGGVWARRGDAILDLLNVIGERTSVGADFITSIGFYTGFFTRVSVGNFTGSYSSVTRTTTNFLGTTNFTTSYSGTYSSFFTSTITKQSVGAYIRGQDRFFTVPAVSATTLIQNTDFLWVKRAN